MKTQILKVMATTLVVALSINCSAQSDSADQNESNNNEQNVESNLPSMSVTFDNSVTTGASAWVTIYNTFGSIRDVGCVNAGEKRTWTGYYPPLSYKVRAEIAPAGNCQGGKIGDISKWLGKTADGEAARLVSYKIGDRTEYTLDTYSAGKPTNVKLPGSSISVLNGVETGASAWITIYNVFDSIRDVGCVNAGELKTWGGYYPPFVFKVRAEIIAGKDCRGAKVADIKEYAENSTKGQGMRILSFGNPVQYKLQPYTEVSLKKQGEDFRTEQNDAN